MSHDFECLMPTETSWISISWSISTRPLLDSIWKTKAIATWKDLVPGGAEKINDNAHFAVLTCLQTGFDMILEQEIDSQLFRCFLPWYYLWTNIGIWSQNGKVYVIIWSVWKKRGWFCVWDPRGTEDDEVGTSFTVSEVRGLKNGIGTRIRLLEKMNGYGLFWCQRRSR